MIYENESELRDRVEQLTGRVIRGQVQIKEDTTEYMRIHGGMILRLDGNDYFVMGDATEGRFGIDDQPKFWVKYAMDLTSGERKVIKLVFYESFTSRMGSLLLKGTRSPKKEAQVLDVVRGHPNFMQGYALHDSAGNLVRMVDFVRGPNLYRYLNDLDVPHELYFNKMLPGIMTKLLDCFEAIDFLLSRGQHHGDIRPDHIIIQREFGRHVWIDFDFEISHDDFDLWSLGDVLVFVIGKGAHTYQEVIQYPELYPVRTESLVLTEHDSMMFVKNQIANLRLLFPYIPEKLNRILVSFSAGTTFFYEDTRTLIDEIRDAFS